MVVVPPEKTSETRRRLAETRAWAKKRRRLAMVVCVKTQSVRREEEGVGEEGVEETEGVVASGGEKMFSNTRPGR